MSVLCSDAYSFALRWVRQTGSSALMKCTLVNSAVAGLGVEEVSLCCAEFLVALLSVNDDYVRVHLHTLVTPLLDSFEDSKHSELLLHSHALVVIAVLRVLFHLDTESLMRYEYTMPLVETLCYLTEHTSKVLYVANDFWWIVMCSGPAVYAAWHSMVLRMLPNMLRRLTLKKDNDMTLHERQEKLRPVVGTLTAIVSPRCAIEKVWPIVCCAEGAERVNTLEAGLFFATIAAEQQAPILHGLDLMRDICNWYTTVPHLKEMCMHTGVLSDLLYRAARWLTQDMTILHSCMNMALDMIHKPYYKALLVRLCNINGNRLLDTIPKMLDLAIQHHDPDTCAAVGAVIVHLPHAEKLEQIQYTRKALAQHPNLYYAVTKSAN